MNSHNSNVAEVKLWMIIDYANDVGPFGLASLYNLLQKQRGKKVAFLTDVNT